MNLFMASKADTSHLLVVYPNNIVTSLTTDNYFKNATIIKQ